MNCSLGDPFLASAPFKIVVSVQALLSALALVINPFVFRVIYSKMYFHRNIRLLLGFGIIVNIVHSFFYLVQQGTHSFLMTTATSGCDILVSPGFCNLLRTPAYLCMLCFTAINNCMVFERLVATIKVRTYEDISTALGFALCGLCILFTLCGPFIINGPLANDYVPYCSLFNSENARQISWSGFGGIVGEVFVILMFITVFYTNKWMEKNQRYNVKIRFQVRENLAVCRMLSPWLLFHFATVMFMLFSSSLTTTLADYDVGRMETRTILASVYIFPLFCVVSPLALNQIYKREQQRRREGIRTISKPATSEEYYLAYTAGWNKK